MRRPINLVELAREIAGRTGDDSDTEGGAIPDLGRIKLGDGEIEGMAKTVLEGADDLAAILERLRVSDLDLEDKPGDGHVLPGKTS